jgi:hypothetical protein
MFNLKNKMKSLRYISNTGLQEGVSEDKWISDSVSSAYMTYNKNWLIEMKEDTRKIKIGDGGNIFIQKFGTWQVMIKDKTGNHKIDSIGQSMLRLRAQVHLNVADENP